MNDALQKLVTALRTRPAMYFGNDCTITALGLYLDGASHVLDLEHDHHAAADDLGAFSMWTVERAGVRFGHFADALRAQHDGDEQSAFDAFFEAWDEYGAYLARRDHVAELAPWHGAMAMLWQFSASLRRIAIRLYRPHEREELFVVAQTCRHMSGPLDWGDNQLEIAPAPPGLDGASHLVRDTQAGFSLRCGGVSLVPSTIADFTLD